MATGVEVFNQGAHSLIHGRQEVVFEIAPGGLVRVPGLVVTQVDLHHADSALDEVFSHEQGPAEAVAAIAVEQLRIDLFQAERVMHLAIAEQTDGGIARGIEGLVTRERGEIIGLFFQRVAQ